MGMDAELLAIGKFTSEVQNDLSYPPEFYEGVPEGTTVITHVANCVTSRDSEGLAAALRIDPWDFSQHCDLSGEETDLMLFAESVEGGSAAVQRFLVLREHGFRFYYTPNG